MFFQLYTNQSMEKVDLATRWFDKHIEPDSTETLLYRYRHVYILGIRICSGPRAKSMHL